MLCAWASIHSTLQLIPTTYDSIHLSAQFQPHTICMLGPGNPDTLQFCICQ
jgi:hypothetical protein